jgi:dTDP-glucose 4,6-dehydratase
MKKYLITGGAGFIGSNFVHYLFKNESNIEVCVLDKLTYSANMASLEKFQGRNDFMFIEGDICDPIVVKKAMEGVNIVVNFAAEVAVDKSINNPLGFLNTDIIGVYTLLNEAKNNIDLHRFVQISTDEVYGHIMSGSFYENSELKPRNPYAASKLGGDRLAYSFYETYNVPVIVTRASNNYGTMAHLEKVIPLFITNLVDGQKVPIYGDGSQIRDWLFVTDHCKGIHLLCEKGINGEVYNIGGEQEYSNLELTKKILKLVGKDESFINYVTDRPGHDQRYSINCDKIKSLGWKQNYNLEKGLEETVKWYLENEKWWRPVKEKMEKDYFSGFWGDK